jgi:putative ABC transport system substrate-binding protein
VPVRAPNDFEDAFAQVRADGLLVLCDALMFQQRRQIVEFIIGKRLPAVTQFEEMTELGALMSYGVDIADLWRRASSYIDKVLKGANPGDLPFEQPTKFELILNLKTAKSIGLTIPPALLLEASSVIE